MLQNPNDFPLIKTPYNIKIGDLTLEFTQNYDYIEEVKSKKKIYLRDIKKNPLRLLN